MHVEDSLLLIVLAVLTLATALNLFLTLRLAAIVQPDSATSVRTVPIGQAVPSFAGRRRADGRRMTSGDLAGQPAVLVFLSPGCSVCRTKVTELVGILPGMRTAGVALWIVPADSVHDISRLLDGTPLLDQVLELDAAARLTLNPGKAAPFYVFIDDRAIAQASNHLGDADWRSFVAQMRDAAGADAAAP